MIKINLIEYFEETCKKWPHRSAVIEGEKVIDFSALSKKVKTLAHLINEGEYGSLLNKPIAVFLPKHRPLWKPMHLQPVFRGTPYYGESIAENLFKSGLCLPSGSNLEERDLNRILNVLKQEI